MPALDHLTPALLAASKHKQFSSDVMFWLIVIVVLGIVLAVVAVFIRKLLFGPDKPTPEGFTLADLRRLHAEGQLSDAELAQAEQKLLSSSRARYLGVEAGSRSNTETDVASGAAAGSGAENLPADPDKNPGDGVEG